MTNHLLRDYEWFVQAESTYGTSPGALAGADAFKHLSNPFVARRTERYFRRRDHDANQASILSVHAGRRSTEFSIECDLTPSNNATTPTEPDVDVFLEAAFGSKHKATAHTTTAAGSAGVTLNLATGGGAASGILAGDMIAVDVDTANGYEVRHVTGIAGDVVTVDRAFTADPATGRTVKVGTTYKLLYSALKSLYLWKFNLDDLRYAIPGSIISQLEVSCDFAQGTPLGNVKFSGQGKRTITQATSRPTPVTVGIPQVPDKGKLWIGTTKLDMINAMFTLNNGLALRNRDSGSMEPNGVKRTNQDGRYDVSATLDFYASTGSPNTKTFYDDADNLTALDCLIQLEDTPGMIVAWRLPSFRPDPEETEQEGEVGYRLSGAAIGVSGDDEVRLAFI